MSTPLAQRPSIKNEEKENAANFSNAVEEKMEIDVETQIKPTDITISNTQMDTVSPVEKKKIKIGEEDTKQNKQAIVATNNVVVEEEVILVCTL